MPPDAGPAVTIEPVCPEVSVVSEYAVGPARPATTAPATITGRARACSRRPMTRSAAHVIPIVSTPTRSTSTPSLVTPASTAASSISPGWSRSMPSKNGVNLYCAVIVKQVDAKTRSKTSINELLRGLAD